MSKAHMIQRVQAAENGAAACGGHRQKSQPRSQAAASAAHGSVQHRQPCIKQPRQHRHRAPSLAGGFVFVHEGAVQAGIALVDGAAAACSTEQRGRAGGTWVEAPAAAGAAAGRWVANTAFYLGQALQKPIVFQHCCASPAPALPPRSLSPRQQGLPSWPQSVGLATHVPLL